MAYLVVRIANDPMCTPNQILIAKPENFVPAVLNGIFDAPEIVNATAITKSRSRVKVLKDSWSGRSSF